MAPPRRLLLLDASCVWPGGHNPRSCRLFARVFESRGYVPRYLVPVHGSAAFPGEETAVQRLLPYPYRRQLGQIEGLPRHPLDQQFDAAADRHKGDGAQRLANRLRLPGADRRLTQLMDGALAPILDGAQLGRDDAILLPTADLYAGGAVLAWLARRPAAERPAVLLRFLGILENEGLFRPRQRLTALLRRAAALRRAGYRVVVAAEIAPWAERLERRADGAFAVPTLPTPPEAPSPPARPRNPTRLGLSLISLRRVEQGVRLLPAIIEGLSATQRQRLDIVAQRTRRSDQQGSSLDERLGALGVRFVPYFSERELGAELAALDLSLITHRPENYVLRGSSALFEAANQGHRVLASAGCGFSPEIEQFGLGPLCRSEAAFTQAIAAVLEDFVAGRHPRTESEPAAARYNAWRLAQAERAIDLLER